jgi:nitrite reductase/ring-hydroxylating ferredoxin subunit
MEPQPITFHGRAYGRKAGEPDETLVRCGPGTAGGELLRRYWHPIAVATDVGDLPQLVKVLGEELVLFRSGAGQFGLLYPRCAHRGTSLLYGRVEEEGIRCPYHGLMFGPEGQCLDVPCEKSPSAVTQKIHQPWYPVVERFGLVFTYMGPPQLQPPFPELSLLEQLGPDEVLVPRQQTTGPNGPHPKIGARTDYNWWQVFDNFIDPFHVFVTHHLINGDQFVPSLGILPDVSFEYLPDGVRSVQTRTLPDGRLHQRVSQVILPNMHCTPGITDEDLAQSGIGWVVPADDVSYKHFTLYRSKKGVSTVSNFENVGMLKDDWGPKHGKPFTQWSLEDHQRWQTDYITQKSQGDINLHSEENLTPIDKGIGMMRRLFKKQAEAVARGELPIGAAPNEPRHIRVVAGNALLDPTTGACIDGFDGRL